MGNSLKKKLYFLRIGGVTEEMWRGWWFQPENCLFSETIAVTAMIPAISDLWMKKW